VSSQDRGLLARLDTLVELLADRHGPAQLPDGHLATAEASVAARAAGVPAVEWRPDRPLEAVLEEVATFQRRIRGRA